MSASASSAGGGSSSAFSSYGPGQITPVEVVELWRALVDLYDDTKARMIAWTGIATPADADIKTRMMCALSPAFQAYPEFTHLRLPGAPYRTEETHTW